MFEFDKATGRITMHRGDTGAYKVRASRKSGEAFTSADRMLFTVRDAQGNIKMQRFYRLDTDLGNGVAEIQFHNNDTDQWENGTYSMERRYVIAPRWEGTAPAGDVVNALTAGARMVEGDVVRVPPIGQGTITIQHVYGDV